MNSILFEHQWMNEYGIYKAQSYSYKKCPSAEQSEATEESRQEETPAPES